MSSKIGHVAAKISVENKGMQMLSGIFHAGLFTNPKPNICSGSPNLPGPKAVQVYRNF